MGTIPPTRPVVGGNVGMNLHLSEIVSDVLDPVVEEYVGGCEIVSTEDLAARMDIKNEENQSWNSLSYWNGKREDRYVACGNCPGDPGLEFDIEKPEYCNCQEYRSLPRSNIEDKTGVTTGVGGIGVC